LKAKAVLFDLFGTLLVYGDMALAWKDWIDDMQLGLNRLGLGLGREQVSLACDGFFGGVCAPAEGLTVYETRIRNLALSLGAQPSDEWCRELAAESLVRWQAQISLDPDALPTLHRLREQGLLVGVLSNFDHHPHVHRVLAETGLGPLLDAIVISGAVGLKKPDPRIFYLACEKMGASAADTIFVGDHPEQDFEGAHNAGLHAVLLQRKASGVDRLQMNYYSDMAQGLDQGAEKAAHRIVSGLPQILSIVEN
jgi:putative hydrolase of the HAD superfamily